MAIIEGLSGSGVSLTANAKAKESTKKMGHNLLLVALALQVCVSYSCTSPLSSIDDASRLEFLRKAKL